jgi:hypothetical protein
MFKKGVVLWVSVAFGASLGACSDDDAQIKMPKHKIQLEEAYRDAFDHHPFGGRPLSWWRKKLNELAAVKDPASAKVLATMKKRAENAGLAVVEKDGRLEVGLHPDALRKVIALVDAQ